MATIRPPTPPHPPPAVSVSKGISTNTRCKQRSKLPWSYHAISGKKCTEASS